MTRKYSLKSHSNNTTQNKAFYSLNNRSLQMTTGLQVTSGMFPLLWIKVDFCVVCSKSEVCAEHLH